MIVVCPSCEPFEHGDRPIRWRLCQHHEKQLEDVARDRHRRLCRDAVAVLVRILWTVVPLAAAEQRGRDEAREEWQQYAWERSERD